MNGSMARDRRLFPPKCARAVRFGIWYCYAEFYMKFVPPEYGKRSMANFRRKFSILRWYKFHVELCVAIYQTGLARARFGRNNIHPAIVSFVQVEDFSPTKGPRRPTVGCNPPRAGWSLNSRYGRGRDSFE